MKLSEVKRFATIYETHLKLLTLQGKSDSMIRDQRALSPESEAIMTVVRITLNREQLKELLCRAGSSTFIEHHQNRKVWTDLPLKLVLNRDSQ